MITRPGALQSSFPGLPSRPPGFQLSHSLLHTSRQITLSLMRGKNFPFIEVRGLTSMLAPECTIIDNDIPLPIPGSCSSFWRDQAWNATTGLNELYLTKIRLRQTMEIFYKFGHKILYCTEKSGLVRNADWNMKWWGSGQCVGRWPSGRKILMRSAGRSPPSSLETRWKLLII